MVGAVTLLSAVCRAACAAVVLIALTGRAFTAAEDPAFVKAKAAFEALDRPTRKAIQRDLIWVASYEGLPDGNFGRLTFEAIRTYQRTIGAPSDGVLSQAAASALAAAGAAKRNEVEFVRVYQESIGVILGVPRKILSKWTPGNSEPIASSPDGSVQVRFFRRTGASMTLASFFAAELKETPTRHVTYRFPRGNVEPQDAITVAGDDAGRQFYTRALGRAGDVRGFTATWDSKLHPGFDQMVVAIVADFDAFPTEAAITELRRPAAPGREVPKEPPPRVASAVTIGTGFFVASDGRAIVPKPAGACSSPMAEGFGALTVRNSSGPGLFLAAQAERAPTGLSPLSATKPNFPGQFYVVSAAGSDAGLIGEGARVSGAMLAGGSSNSTYQIASALPPGAQGAPVVDARGRLIGVVADAQSGLTGGSDWRPGPYKVEPIGAVARQVQLHDAMREADDGTLPLDEIAKSVFAVVCQR
jgi:hypothetical protein